MKRDTGKDIELTLEQLDAVSGGDKSAPTTTVGGSTRGRGHTITNGGNNSNVAAGAFPLD
jgi:hypothetical protein